MAPPVTDAELVITVTRSGGFAGIRRVWEVRVPDGEPQVQRWRAMVAPLAASSGTDGAREPTDPVSDERDDAPGDTDAVGGDRVDQTPSAPSPTPDTEHAATPVDEPAPIATSRPRHGADRFVWSIVVVDDPDRWTLRCAENELTDDARTLIDAVRRDGSRPG